MYTYDTEKAKKLLEEAGVSDLSFKLLTNNNWVKGLAAQIKNDLEAAGVKCEIQEEKINWSALAESDSVLDYDVMLTPGDPTCFGNDPDLLMSWWYGDNTWTRGRSCWAKAADGKWKEAPSSAGGSRRGRREGSAGAVEPVLRHHRRVLPAATRCSIARLQLATGPTRSAASSLRDHGPVFIDASPAATTREVI